MCLAVPFRIISVTGERAVVEAAGVRREVVVAFVTNPRPGEYVLVHAGVAIRKWTAEDVAEFEAITGARLARPSV